MNMMSKKRPDFLSEVVDDMGDEDGNAKYGATMDDGDGADSEDADETVKEDRLMAAKQARKAMASGDDAAFASALETFVKTCM